MPKTIAASLCLTIALTLSLSDAAWSQSATPLAIPTTQLQQRIESTKLTRALLEQQLLQFKKASKETTKRLDDVDNQLQSAGVSMESFPGILKSLQTKRIDLMIDLTGLTAKREAILAAQKITEDRPDSPTKNKTILADSLLETSLALAEKKARLELVKYLLATVKSSRSLHTSANALTTKSNHITTYESKISSELIKNDGELITLECTLEKSQLGK